MLPSILIFYIIHYYLQFYRSLINTAHQLGRLTHNSIHFTRNTFKSVTCHTTSFRYIFDRELSYLILPSSAPTSARLFLACFIYCLCSEYEACKCCYSNGSFAIFRLSFHQHDARELCAGQEQATIIFFYDRVCHLKTDAHKGSEAWPTSRSWVDIYNPNHNLRVSFVTFFPSAAFSPPGMHILQSTILPSLRKIMRLPPSLLYSF